MGVISRVPLKRGFLAGRFSVDRQFVEGDARRRTLTPEAMRKYQQKLDNLKEISAESGLSTAELAIRFCVSESECIHGHDGYPNGEPGLTERGLRP